MTVRSSSPAAGESVCTVRRSIFPSRLPVRPWGARSREQSLAGELYALRARLHRTGGEKAKKLTLGSPNVVSPVANINVGGRVHSDAGRKDQSDAGRPAGGNCRDYIW